MNSLLHRFALVCSLATPLAVAGQTPFAGEDFDGGATNGGFTATTMSFTPDLSGSSVRGTFTTGSGSLFDRFGEVSRADNLPFGLADDSLTIFPGDTSGFIAESKTDDFVLSVDVENPTNPSGIVSAEWTFDITGKSNLELSMDFGMLGDFEEADLYEFSYSIDGGPAALAFSITGESGTFYSYTMDDGTFIDRSTSTFFSETDWFDLVDLGPMGDINYHPADTGLDGDTTAQDGFVPVTFADGVEEVRAMLDRTFEETEFEPVSDPLVITTGDGTLVSEQLIADFANYKTALVGTGSTLTLTLNGASNGGDEYFAFDNILLSEGAVVALDGDYNNDGFVDAADYTVWRDGDSPDSTEAGYTLWANNYGAGTPPSSVAIPEPTAALLALLAVAGVAARRNG